MNIQTAGFPTAELFTLLFGLLCGGSGLDSLGDELPCRPCDGSVVLIGKALDNSFEFGSDPDGYNRLLFH